MSSSFWKYAAVFLIAFAGVTSAEAGVVGNLIKGLNELEDDDFETHIKFGGTVSSPGASSIVEEDDYLVGVVRITNFITAGFDPGDTFGDPTLTFLFAAQVDTAVMNGAGDWDFTFNPLDAADWTALGMPVTPDNDGVFGILYDDPDNINEKEDDLATALATANGTKLYEFGFTGKAGETWQATTSSNDTDDAGLGGFGSFGAFLNVVERFAGPELIPMPIDLFFPGAPGEADLAIVNGGLRGPGTTVGDGFDIQSDADFFLNAVPEPNTLAVFATIGVVGLVGRRRRA